MIDQDPYHIRGSRLEITLNHEQNGAASMSTQLPPCFLPAGKCKRVEQVLQLIRDNPEITFRELHGLVKDRLGVSGTTAYDYL